jgi:hypothetical protein
MICFDEIRELCRGLDGDIEWYIFGSATHEGSCPLDVDLLAVADDPITIIGIRRMTSRLLCANPIDLTIMSRGEENELGFIEEVRAQHIP